MAGKCGKDGENAGQKFKNGRVNGGISLRWRERKRITSFKERRAEPGNRAK